MGLRGDRNIWAAVVIWGGLGGVLVGATLAFHASVPLFELGPGIATAPIWPLVGLLAFAGLVHAVALPHAVQDTERRGATAVAAATLIVIAAGLLARLALLTGPVMLDDDVHRYLWDGAVVAHGYDPYRQSPTEIGSRPRTEELAALAAKGRATLELVNHPELTTVYPPAAQAMFAVGHWIAPFSLPAWRIVVLALELTLLAGLLVLCRQCGRSPLWVALYWWHPLVLKEFAHAGHMEAVLLPLVVWSLVAAGRGRLLIAVALLALATATKFWPALLLPLVLRPALGPLLWPTARAVGLAGLFGGLTLVLLAPMLRAPVGETTGIVAYASYWTTNSALLPALERLVASVLALAGVGLPVTTTALIVKGALAAALGLAAIGLARQDIASPADLAHRAAILVAAIVLLSPAQFPWYTLWFAPFLVVAPFAAMRAIAVTVPLYYGSFWFAARGQADVHAHGMVWAIWVPVWVVLAWSVANWVKSRRNVVTA